MTEKSKKFPVQLTQEEFEDCFADIDTIVDDQEHDELTFAIAFSELTPAHKSRLKEVKGRDEQIYDGLIST